MNGFSRLPAAAAYLPIIGWLYIFFVQRQNPLAMYHLRQSIGLCLFLVAVLIGWVGIAWVLAWLPFMGALGAGLFTLVIAAYLFGVGAWSVGLINAMRKKAAPLPGVGSWAEHLPIK